MQVIDLIRMERFVKQEWSLGGGGATNLQWLQSPENRDLVGGGRKGTARMAEAARYDKDFY